MARNLLETITERAMNSFIGETNQFPNHWFDTADKFKQELITEGLIASATHVDKLIDQQRRILK